MMIRTTVMLNKRYVFEVRDTLCFSGHILIVYQM